MIGWTSFTTLDIKPPTTYKLDCVYNHPHSSSLTVGMHHNFTVIAHLLHGYSKCLVTRNSLLKFWFCTRIWVLDKQETMSTRLHWVCHIQVLRSTVYTELKVAICFPTSNWDGVLEPIEVCFLFHTGYFVGMTQRLLCYSQI